MSLMAGQRHGRRRASRSDRGADGATLPAAWARAFERDRTAPAGGADPLPERRVARLLAAFIASGLVFLVLPGTLLGVWTLIGISSRQSASAMPVGFIQSHGHAQLFGWLGSFMIGISLYTFAKFRGAGLRSLRVGWLMLVLWTGGVAARWASGMAAWRWNTVWPASAMAELATAVLLLWQVTARSRRHRESEPWNVLGLAGFCGLIVVLGWQVALVRAPRASPAVPEGPEKALLWLALWIFCFPVAWGYSARLLPSFLGLRRMPPWAAWAGLGLVGAAAFWHPLVVAAALLAGWSLGVFAPAARPAKTIGVDPQYPYFVRLAFVWLVIAAALSVGERVPGVGGAYRHAFTVGFVATLVFSIGPRILPSFLNSRELWSPRLMLASLALLTAGCALRVSMEPLAYAGDQAFAWRLLPVSATLELIAVVLFAWNMAHTLLSPMPAWILSRTVNANLPLYWYVTAYPDTRALLARAGLKTLEHARRVPRSLTLKEAAEADAVDWRPLVAELRRFFESRAARALRERPKPC
ncbi:MAG: NnrS family protein [Acidobacteria bacterium]|nr:NnrS family protein [Acidobacteriota bacterium]